MQLTSIYMRIFHIDVDSRNTGSTQDQYLYARIVQSEINPIIDVCEEESIQNVAVLSTSRGIQYNIYLCFPLKKLNPSIERGDKYTVIAMWTCQNQSFNQICYMLVFASIVSQPYVYIFAFFVCLFGQQQCGHFMLEFGFSSMNQQICLVLIAVLPKEVIAPHNQLTSFFNK